MANAPDNKEKPAAKEKPAMTNADAAKLVKRSVQKIVDGKPVFDKNNAPVLVDKAVKEDEVHAFAEYDNKVVVLLTDGTKLVHEK